MSPNENSLLKIKLNLCEIHKRKAGDGERNPTYKVLSLFCSWHKLLDMLLIFVPVKVLWENIVCLRNDSSWDGKQNAVLTEKSTHSHICIGTRVHVSHCLSSVQFSRSVMSDSLRPHESQHARPPCPSPTPGVHPDSRPSSHWCHPAISSSDYSLKWGEERTL